MWNRGFEGWYCKLQREDDTLAFIPGRSESGAFVQLLSREGVRQFDLPTLSVRGDTVRTGGCLFSPRGCTVDLPGVRGEVRYGPLTPLRSDIMGPFRFLPMECRHGVLSMTHSLSGSVTVDGALHPFDRGVGYLEKDSGTSFPRSYQWLQCNDFDGPCALVLSLAHIPFCGAHFTGCICAVVFRGKEYRLATYNGVRILDAAETHVRLRQGALLLDAEITPMQRGHPLRSPVRGQMTGTIRESADAAVRLRLSAQGQTLFDLRGARAAYEYVP